MSGVAFFVFLSKPDSIFIARAVNYMVKRVYRRCSQCFVKDLELLLESDLRG